MERIREILLSCLRNLHWPILPGAAVRTCRPGAEK